MVSFDCEKFSKKLASNLKDLGKAQKAVLLHDKYMFCLNLYKGASWNDYFETESEMFSFIQKHNIPKVCIIYDPRDFEKILMSEVSFTVDEAWEYSRTEDEYMTEIGLI